MRLIPLTACLAALCLAPAAAALAQEAPDCGVLCSITGYLSADHMASGGAGDPPAGAPSKPRRARRNAPPLKATAAPARPPRGPAAVQARAPAVARVPAPRLRAASAAPRPIVKPAPSRPAVARLTPPSPLAAAAPKAVTTRTAAVATTIPGSAPAVQAGFH